MIRWLLASCLVILAALSFFSPALAQAGTPFPAPPEARWGTIISGTQDFVYFDSPDEACRAQHASFNPGSIYQSPTAHPDPTLWYVYNCHWVATLQSGTILPADVYLGCPQDWTTTVQGECILRQQGEQGCDCPMGRDSHGQQVGDPISLQSGAKVASELDYETADGLFRVDRYYNSNGRGIATLSSQNVTGFGRLWRGLVPGQLVANSNGMQYFPAGPGVTSFAVVDGANPNSMVFTPDALSPERIISRAHVTFLDTTNLTRAQYLYGAENPLSGGEFRFDTPNGDFILFRRGPALAAGSGTGRVLVPIEHHLASGYTRFFDYQPDRIEPYRIRDSFGRTMTLQWQNVSYVPSVNCTDPNCIALPVPLAPVLASIILPDGTSLSYTYDTARRGGGSGSGTNDRLVIMRHLSSAGQVLQARTYLYENKSFPYAMTGILDRNGNRIETNAYDVSGRATLAEHAGGADRTTVEHRFVNEDITDRIVTNPLGYQSTYRYGNPLDFRLFEWNQPNLLERVDHASTPNIAARSEAFAYNDRYGGYFLNTITDARGITTNLNYDTLGRPLQRFDANGRPEAQLTTLTWHATLDLPRTETRGNLRIKYFFDTQGRMTERREVDISTHSVPYVTAGQTRSWTYVWNANGRLVSVNGPRSPDALGRDDIDGFTYDAAGNMLTATNGLAQVTTYSSYDANGRPGRVTDPNGINTDLVYDPLGRLISLSVREPGTGTAHATTTFEYDSEGRVTGFTRPATARLGMTYDLAGRLLTVSAPTGEAITYTYDAMGNVTRQRVTNAAAATRSDVTRTFDELGRMLTETLGLGRTASFTYDATGNPTRVISPRTFATDRAFDGLARLISATMPDTGAVANAYNQNDDLVSHSDAIAVTTTMVYNGFGEVIQEINPDRGTSTYTYNSGGDLVSATDGRGQRVDYSYDSLGRVLTRTPLGHTAEGVTYIYDSVAISGLYAIGRLSQITDGSGTTQFTYDHRGNVLMQAQVIDGSAAFNTSYLYDLADRIARIIYPSGRKVTYLRDEQGRVITVTTRALGESVATTLLSLATYEPFGALTNAILGNSQRFAQIYDATGRRTARRYRASNDVTNIWSVAYAYDNDDNIVGITDLVDASRNLSFQYDSVDRLTRVDMAVGALRREDYSFDANGNRLSVERRALPGDVAPAANDNYALDPGTNRLASITTLAGTRSFSHDARGNLSCETRPGGVSVTAAYDGYARLTSYTRTNEQPLAMRYNGMDQRVALTTGTITRRFIQDRDGRMLGEYGANGTQPFAEYIWLLPEAANDNVYGGDDGIGGWTPLAVVTSDGTTAAAQLHYLHTNHLGVPVGSYDAGGAATTLPAITALGFPGQQLLLPDLYYNQYRDYDPSTGRYIQADPIGLVGDANPYAYAGGNPVRNVDPLGLQIADITTHPAFQTAGRLAARTPPGRIGWVIGTVARVIYDSCGGDDESEDDSACEAQLEEDQFECNQWNIYGRLSGYERREGYRVCIASSMQRYAECRSRGMNPNNITSPLFLPTRRHGIEEPSRSRR